MFIADEKARILLGLARKWRTAPPGRSTEGAGEVLSEVVEQSLGDIEKPSPFQANRDKILAALRASIAPTGPTAEQVDTVEKLLDAVPEGWWHLLPLSECETWKSDAGDRAGPMISFSAMRACLRVCILGQEVFVQRRVALDGVMVAWFEFSMTDDPWADDRKRKWQTKWHDCLRWFIGESLEV